MAPPVGSTVKRYKLVSERERDATLELFALLLNTSHAPRQAKHLELLQFARLAAASRLPLRLTAAAAPLRHCDLELCGQTRSCTHIIASIVGYVPPLNCWWIRHHCIESRESLRSARRGLHREIVGAVRRRSRNLCLKGLSYVRACMRVHTCDPALRCRAPIKWPRRGSRARFMSLLCKVVSAGS